MSERRRDNVFTMFIRAAVVSLLTVVVLGACDAMLHRGEPGGQVAVELRADELDRDTDLDELIIVVVPENWIDEEFAREDREEFPHPDEVFGGDFADAVEENRAALVKRDLSDEELIDRTGSASLELEPGDYHIYAGVTAFSSLI